MPIYTYGCEDEAHWFEESRPCDSRHDPIDCPVCGEPAELRPSLPLPHIWDAHAARDIECRSSTKEAHTGVLPDGTPFRTIGGPPPAAMVKQHGG